MVELKACATKPWVQKPRLDAWTHERQTLAASVSFLAHQALRPCSAVWDGRAFDLLLLAEVADWLLRTWIGHVCTHLFFVLYIYIM